jgi:hypothetical protein
MMIITLFYSDAMDCTKINKYYAGYRMVEWDENTLIKVFSGEQLPLIKPSLVETKAIDPPGNVKVN